MGRWKGEEGREGGITKGHEKTFGGDRFIILIVVMISWLYTYVKTHQVLHFIYVQFTVCRLYLNN